MIELTPPLNDNPWAEFQRTSFNTKIPPHRIKLHTGATVFPDRETGLIKVRDEEDAQALEAMGWGRDKISTHFKQVESDLLRKAYTGQIVRETGGNTAMPSTTGRVPSDSELLRRGLARQIDRLPNSAGSADRRIVFGTVEAKGGQVFVEHDQSADVVVIHGVAARLADITPSLRSSFLYASSAFSQAENEAEQVTARTLVGLVVNEIIDRHDFVGAEVKGRLFSQRYD